MLGNGELVPVLGLFRMTRMGEGGCGPSPGKLCLTGVWVGSVIKNVHTIKNVPERHSLQKAKPRKAEQGSEGSSPYGTRNIYSGNIPCRQHTGLQSSSSPMTETCPYWSASSALWPGIRTCHLTHRWIVLFCSSQVLFVYFLTPQANFFFLVWLLSGSLVVSLSAGGYFDAAFSAGLTGFLDSWGGGLLKT